MSDIEIVQAYERPRAVVWRVLTDPDLVPLWTSTGRGGAPRGFVPEVGTHFEFVGRPVPGWDGVVRCEVLEVDAPRLLRYSWRGSEQERPSEVTYLLEEIPGGTRFSYRHTAFHGLMGLVMSRLLGRVRRTMLTDGVPVALQQVADPEEQSQDD